MLTDSRQHDLAACITAELERMAQEQAAVVNQRMHQGMSNIYDFTEGAPADSGMHS